AHTDAGTDDGFVAALRDTPALVMSTFVGSPKPELITGLTLSADGGVLVVGDAIGTDDPFYAGSKLHAPTTGRDVFLAKLTGALNLQVAWADVIGGANGEFSSGLAVDARDNVYVTASGGSSLAKVTPQALESVLPAGGNGYFAIVDPAVSRFVYLTYV